MVKKKHSIIWRSRVGRLHDLLLRHRVFLGGTLYEYVGVGLLFFLTTLFLTNFTILQGDHKLFIDGPGDGTAGFLWFNTVENDANPILGHTDMANYPEGENLFNPTQVTYTLVWGPLWALSKIFGPTMGLNMVTFAGIFLCAVSMYWLVKKLTGNPYVAFFAGYAAAFTPYHLVKSSSHLTYIFSVVFVLMIAAFIGYWKRPSVRRALLFTVMLAVAFYTDGYYLLLGTTLAGLLVIAGFVFDSATGRLRELLMIRLRHMAIAAGALVVLLAPIGLTQVFQGSGVDRFLSGARGSIAFDIEYYASKPIDFLVPSPLNPFLWENDDFRDIVKYQNTRSNTAENNTYIGYVILVLVVAGTVLLLTSRLFGRRSQLYKYSYSNDFKLVYAIGLVAAPVLVWCMLAPSFTIFGKPVVTPADLLLHFDVSLWRVMARFYLPLHVILVLMASLSLALLYASLKRRYGNRLLSTPSYAVVLIALLITAAEYATLLSGVSYDFKKLPRVYSQIRDDKDIKVVAELPLLDRPLSENYNFATAQVVHGKKIINTPLTNNTPGLRTALGNSIEAVDYAIARGADTIITHNIECKHQPWGTLKYKDNNKPLSNESGYYGSPICVYKVNGEYRADELFVKLRYGIFSDAPYIDKQQKAHQLLYMEDGWLDIVDQYGQVPGSQLGVNARFTASVQLAPGKVVTYGARWSVYQNGILIQEGALPGHISIDSIDASKPLHIKITNLNNPTLEPFRVSLTDIVATKQ